MSRLLERHSINVLTELNKYMCARVLQNVSGQVGAAEATGSAAEGRRAADVHEENEEARTAVSRTASAEFTLGHTGTGGRPGGVQERKGAGQQGVRGGNATGVDSGEGELYVENIHLHPAS